MPDSEGMIFRLHGSTVCKKKDMCKIGIPGLGMLLLCPATENDTARNTKKLDKPERF